MSVKVAIHQSPDWDALGFVYVLEHALRETAHVVFVPAGQTDVTADYVGDTGRELNLSAGRFDHHQLTGDQAKTSATKLVYEYFSGKCDISYLYELVHLINQCDLGARHESRSTGIHALLAGYKAQGATDEEILIFGRNLFNLVASGLQQKQNARTELKSYTDHTRGTVIVLKENAPRGCTQAAYDNGFGVVFYQSTYVRDGQTYYVRGAVRDNAIADQVHLGDRLSDVLNSRIPQDVRVELETWYQHPAGFMVGLSEKAQGATSPMPDGLTLTYIASLLLP